MLVHGERGIRELQVGIVARGRCVGLAEAEEVVTGPSVLGGGSGGGRSSRRRLGVGWVESLTGLSGGAGGGVSTSETACAG